MTYGELASHSEDYRDGHAKGAERAFSDVLDIFRNIQENQPRRVLTASECIVMMEECREYFNRFCDSYGMGHDFFSDFKLMD